MMLVCPNDVVDQWARSIIEIFPDSKVITGKEAFYQKYDVNNYQYLVLNYDKFSQEDSPNLILNLAKEKIDFVVLDEIHFVKKRDDLSSQRRRNLDGLMTAVRKKNSNLKVLGLSATPVAISTSFPIVRYSVTYGILYITRLYDSISIPITNDCVLTAHLTWI